MCNLGRRITHRLMVTGLLTALLAGCASSLPSMEGRSATAAPTDTSGTRLGAAMAASDGSAVHSRYAKRRREPLNAGVRLCELKPSANQEASGDSGGVVSTSPLGLHAKTFAVDRERIFVGSFNFDTRSALLNTEMGLVVSSPALARQMSEEFDRGVPLVTYKVVLGPDGKSLQWIERTAAGEQRHDTEPGTGVLKRMGSAGDVRPADRVAALTWRAFTPAERGT